MTLKNLNTHRLRRWDGKWSLTIFIFPGMFHYRGECVRHIPRYSGRSRSQGSDECYQSQSCQSRDINYVCVGGGEHVGRCRCRDDMKVNQWWVQTQLMSTFFNFSISLFLKIGPKHLINLLIKFKYVIVIYLNIS